MKSWIEPGRSMESSRRWAALEERVDTAVGQALNEIRVLARRARIDLGIIDPKAIHQIRKLHEIQTGRYYRLPHPHFKCPECGDQIAFEIDEWDPWFGIPTRSGVRVCCVAEEAVLMDAFDNDDNPSWEHRWWQSDWQPVIDRVERYVLRRCRVVELAR